MELVTFDTLHIMASSNENVYMSDHVSEERGVVVGFIVLFFQAWS